MDGAAMVVDGEAAREMANGEGAVPLTTMLTVGLPVQGLEK